MIKQAEQFEIHGVKLKGNINRVLYQFLIECLFTH